MCPERYQTHAWGANISQGSHYPPHACLNVGPSQLESPWELCYLGRDANDLLRNAASGQRPVRGSYLQPHSPRDPGWYTLETWRVRCDCQAYQDHTIPRTDTGDSSAPGPRQYPVPHPGDGPVFTTRQCHAACTRPTFPLWPHPWWPSPYIPHLQPPF